MKVFLKFLPAVVLATAFAMPAQADYAEANVNGDAARLAYGWEGKRNQSDIQAEVALLIGEEEDDQKAHVGSFGLSVFGDAGAGEAWKLRAGLGGRLYGGTVEVPGGEDQSGGALAIGGEFSLRFPSADRLGISGRLFYAPDILAFSDVSELLDIALRLEFEVLRNATAYLGTRLVRVESSDFNDDIDLDKGVNVGLRINF